MKKLLAFCLALTLIFPVCACGSSDAETALALTQEELSLCQDELAQTKESLDKINSLLKSRQEELDKAKAKISELNKIVDIYTQPDEISQMGFDFTYSDMILGDAVLIPSEITELVENQGIPEGTQFFDSRMDWCKYIAAITLDGIEYLCYLNSKDEAGFADMAFLSTAIVGGEHEFLGVYPGMSESDFSVVHRDRAIYTCRQIEERDSVKLDNDSSLEERLAYTSASDIAHILSYYPSATFDGYDGCAYFRGSVTKIEEYEYGSVYGSALGAVVFFKNGTVSRIVFGSPTAG